MNTPLEYSGEGSVFDNNGQMVAKASAFGWSTEEKLNHAALIVRAVNSHEALVAALEKIVEIGMLAEPPGYESFTDEQKQKHPRIYSEEAHVALAALKLAKGEA